MNSPLKVLIFTNSLILIGGAMLAPIYALFVENIGGDILDASSIFMIFSLSAGITTIVSGKIADKLPHGKYLVIFGYIIIALAQLLYTQVDTLVALAAVQILVGFGEAVYAPAFDGLFSKHLDKGKEYSEWGLWESNFYFTSAIGSIIGGLIVTEFGFDFLFFGMSFISLLSALFLFHYKIEDE